MRALPACLLMSVLLLGCAGGGTGQVTGTLFLRGCPDQGTDDPTGMPTPLPAFDLSPSFFAAEPILAFLPDLDPRGINRLLIRLQRSPNKAELTDVFTLYVDDVKTQLTRLGAPQAITPPALGGTSVPLPTQGSTRVLGSLSLTGTCPVARAQPSLTGTVTFSALGRNAGDPVAGQFSVTVSDPRAARDSVPAGDQDAAGAFAGSFQFPVQFGPASQWP